MDNSRSEKSPIISYLAEAGHINSIGVFRVFKWLLLCFHHHIEPVDKRKCVGWWLWEGAVTNLVP